MISFRQAFILSLTFHLLLLPGMGWLADNWLKREQATNFIELELAAGDPGPAAGPATLGTTLADSLPVQSETAAPAAIPAAAPAPEPPAAETVAAPVDTNKMTASADVSKVTAPAVPAAAYSHNNVPGGHEGASLGGGAGDGTGGSAQGQGSGTGGNGGSGGSGTAAPAVILPPRVLERQEPEYPVAARRANQEGTVSLRIEILTNGLPGNISIARSSGYSLLDQAAAAAVRNWRFVPARDSKTNAPVASVTTLSVAFRLQ